jgi:lysozyme
MEKDEFTFDEEPQKVSLVRRAYNLLFSDSPRLYSSIHQRKRIGLAILIGMPLSFGITSLVQNYFEKPEDKFPATQESRLISQELPGESEKLIIPKAVQEDLRQNTQPKEEAIYQPTSQKSEKQIPTARNNQLEKKVSQLAESKDIPATQPTSRPTTQNSPLEETVSNYVVTCDVFQEISIEGLKLIKKFEAFKGKPYYCPAGKLTVGYGHVIKEGEKFDKLDKNQAEQLLREDAGIAENIVEKYVRVDLSQGQYDALCSFVFNVGEERFRKSTLLKRLNREDYEGAAKAFSNWVYAKEITEKGEIKVKKLKGLEKRRRAEEALFKLPEKESPFNQ